MSRFLQVAGMVAITVGMGFISIPLAVIVGGVFLLVVGLSLAV